MSLGSQIDHLAFEIVIPYYGIKLRNFSEIKSNTILLSVFTITKKMVRF